MKSQREARTKEPASAVAVYPDGRPYVEPLGHNAPKPKVIDLVKQKLAVVDLDREQPSAREFLGRILRELKIRFYLQNTNRNYRSHLRSFLRWFGAKPHQITREHVRQYLEYLVDAGLEANTVANHLSSIRTAFDKLCFRELTLGLATPRTVTDFA